MSRPQHKRRKKPLVTKGWNKVFQDQTSLLRFLPIRIYDTSNEGDKREEGGGGKKRKYCRNELSLPSSLS